jgi:hypothetical protein
VNQATSTTAVVSSVNPSKEAQKGKFTATVTSPTATPTGTVTFMDGSTELGTGTLAQGKASYSTSTLSAGTHNITAVYQGTARHQREHISGIGADRELKDWLVHTNESAPDSTSSESLAIRPRSG